MKKILLTLCLTGLLAGLAGADCCDGNAKKAQGGKVKDGWFTTHTVPGNPDCCKGLSVDSADCCKNQVGGQSGCKGDCGGTCSDKSRSKKSTSECKDKSCGDKAECKDCK